MKFKVPMISEVEYDVATVQLELPVRYDEEDMPDDFPFRKGDLWTVNVNVETGQIKDWPADYLPGCEHDNALEDGAFGLCMKVTDSGVYRLVGSDGKVIKEIDGYVPDAIPGEYGVYVELHIEQDGRISNWPKPFDAALFFSDPDRLEPA